VCWCICVYTCMCVNACTFFVSCMHATRAATPVPVAAVAHTSVLPSVSIVHWPTERKANVAMRSSRTEVYCSALQPLELLRLHGPQRSFSSGLLPNPLRLLSLHAAKWRFFPPSKQCPTNKTAVLTASNCHVVFTWPTQCWETDVRFI
jgi:hypothetical protein